MKAVRLWEKNNTSPVDLLHTRSLCIQEIYGFKKQYNKNSYCHVKTFAFTLRFSVFLHKYDLSLDLVLKVELDENSSHNSYKTTVSHVHTWLLFMHRRALTCICGWHGLLCSWPLAVISMMQSCFFLVQCSLRAWTLHAPNIDCQPCLLLIEISSDYTVESLPNLKLRNSIWIFSLQFVDAGFFFFFCRLMDLCSSIGVCQLLHSVIHILHNGISGWPREN